jgi:hypothetical protein
MYIKLPMYLFYTLKIHTMILMWTIPVPVSISYLYAHTATTKPLLPIQQISVRMRGG